jgi:hypothetical protein
MPDNDWEHGLEALAHHAARTGPAGTAAGARARGDRRRRNQRAVTGALGVVLVGALGAGIAFGQTRGGQPPAPPADSGRPSPSATATTSPPPSSPPPKPSAPVTSASSAPRPTRQPVEPTRNGSDASAVFLGKRQILVQPVGDESTLAVGDNDQVGPSEDFGDAALFVLTPLEPGGSEYWIRTAKLRVGGEALCLALEVNDGTPRRVFATACDAGDHAQSFRFGEAGDNSEGEPTYTIRNGTGTYLTMDLRGELDPGGNGLVAQPVGDGQPDSTFLLVDRGKAALPSLD